jgi:DNA repair exonuclease SbcCD ATPase subunit
MARATEVSPSVSSSPNSINDDKDDATSLKIKEEIVVLDYFLSNVQGESKKHFEAILRQLAEANARLEEKGRIEREDAIEIASLNNALEEEQETRVSLEETLETIEESHNELNSQLIKERDRAIAKYKKLKREKVEFGVGHDKLNEELEKLDKAHKALESEHSTLVELHEQLQTQLAVCDVSTSSICEHANILEEHAKLKEEMSLYMETNKHLESLITKYGLDYFPNDSICEQATILEENVRLTKELAKLTSSKGKMSLDDLLSKQRSPYNKHGLGYVPYANKKKEMPAQAKNKTVFCGNKASKGNVTKKDHTGLDNPHYELFADYYGDVYARYVGPYDGYIARSIWVPKTLVTNMRGPIVKWVPKSKH